MKAKIKELTSRSNGWGNTRKGYWHIAKSYILTRTITNERLCKAGYVFFTDYYEAVRR
jgi:hypothetical protein